MPAPAMNNVELGWTRSHFCSHCTHFGSDLLRKDWLLRGVERVKGIEPSFVWCKVVRNCKQWQIGFGRGSDARMENRMQAVVSLHS